MRRQCSAPTERLTTVGRALDQAAGLLLAFPPAWPRTSVDSRLQLFCLLHSLGSMTILIPGGFLMQRIELPFPGQLRLSPDIKDVRQHDLRWVGTWGLAVTKQEMRRYRSWDIGALAAHAYPEATGHDLELGANTLGWFTLFDDQFDGPLGARPGEVSHICHQMLCAIDRRRQSNLDDPLRSLADALRDLWERSTDGMPSGWRTRFRNSWEMSFAGFVQEAEDRVSDAVTTPGSYFRKRVRSLGTYVWCDLAERLERCLVPEQAWDLPALGELRRLHGEICVMVNDAFSFEREAELGDVTGNLISLTRRNRDITLAEATAELIRLAEQTLQEITRRQAQLPTIGDQLLLSPEERARLTHYGDCLASMSRGNYDWSRKTLRYTATDAFGTT